MNKTAMSLIGGLACLMLAGCSQSAKSTASSDSKELQNKIAHLEEVNHVQTKLMNVQFLMLENQDQNAEKTISNLLEDIQGNKDFSDEIQLANALLEHLKLEQKDQAPQSDKSTQSSPKEENFTYKSYSNARFGFTVQYPDTFTAGPEPTNGDGRSFDNGECEITASGSHVVLDNPLEKELEWAVSDAPNGISYKKVGDNWFAISYKDGSKTVYQKTIIQNGISYHLVITYPSDQQAKYGEMVTHIVQTFKPGHGEN